MTHAWFDISAGVAGDMLLGALIDAGANVPAIQDVWNELVPDSVTLETAVVKRNGQRATKAKVLMTATNPAHRTWGSIRDTLAASGIPEQTRTWSMAVFARLAAAEARVHGVNIDDVHFHEVGALDSIADVVGTCEALRGLGVTSVSASPVALGRGRIQTAHGDMPVPAPAVAELTIGWPSYAGPAGTAAPDTSNSSRHAGKHTSAASQIRLDGHVEADHHVFYEGPAPTLTPGEPGELATPTGLALIRALAEGCEPFPAFTPTAIGVGAGGKDFATHPNVVRVVIGERTAGASDQVVELAANIDDLEPRLWPGVLTVLLSNGALDAWLSPAVMKKGRPAYTLHALAKPASAERVTDIILTNTTTLGVRTSVKSRSILERFWQDVDVAGQQVAVKIGARHGVIVHATPEFDSLAEAAERAKLTPADAAQRASAAIVAAGLIPGAKLGSHARERL